MREANRPLFTVFTATHDRAHTLPRVFDCLARQTLRDFEWLIVDDGSIDGTRTLVEGWQGRTDFPVRYVYQPHAGKHVAFNRGVREARGHLFLPWDSDDGGVPESLERFSAQWESIPAGRRSHFSAVTALRRYEDGRPVGDRFLRDVLDSDPLELYFRFKPRGDKWGFHRTSVLRDNPFPEPAGTTFVPESIVWFAIARRHKTRYVNEYLGINYGSDPAEPHLSTLTVSTAKGRLLFHQAVIEDYLDFAIKSPLLLIRSLINYSRYSFMLGIGPMSQVRRIATPVRRALVLPAIPLGCALHLVDRMPSRLHSEAV